MKCNNCGEKVIKYPLRLQPNKTFKENLEEGTIRWSNLFKMDAMSIFWLITIALILFGFYNYQEQCETIKEECKECMEKPYYQSNNQLPEIETDIGKSTVLEYEGIV